MPAPTRMQWRCLVALDRHDGNRKAAAHAVSITEWTFAYHLRALCRKQGLSSVWAATRFYAAELARANGHPRQKRVPRCRRAHLTPPLPTPPGQVCMGLAS